MNSAFTPISSTTSVRRRLNSDLFSYLGVGVMALLLAVIVVVSTLVMQRLKQAAEVTARERIEKVVLAQTMHQASRERTVLLQRIVLTDDPFERDALILEFQNRANQFSVARAAFIAKGITDEERRLLDAQGNSHKEAAPLQSAILDYVVHDQLAQARVVLNEKEKRLQDNTQVLMVELVNYQTGQTQTAIDEAGAAYDSGMLTIYLVTAIAAITTVILIGLVRRSALERRDYVEQVETANRAKSSFLAKMSHEMRTPLTSVIGFADMSLDADQSMEERVSALKSIKQSSAHLLRIINDILDLAKIEAQKLDIEKSRSELIPLLNDVRALVQMQAKSKKLAFEINFKYPLPRAIETDALRLKQILTNLCGNAIKFTETGFVYLNVSYDRDAEHLLLAVEDSGIGLSGEESARLFGDFQQADSSITRKYGGTGLGLAISRRLALLLGGEISVASKKGAGSIFTVVLPCPGSVAEMILNRDADGASPALSEDEAGAASRYTGKVLVAEDNPQLRELIRVYLKRAGINAEIVENGAEAVARATQAAFDLVFLDIEMPVMDGVAAIIQLRSQNIRIPVVALTANAMQGDQARYRDAGFTAVLDKPIDRKKFYGVLDEHLEKSKPVGHLDQAPIFAEYMDAEADIDDDMQAIFDSFVERLPHFCEQLTRAIAAKNWEAARAVAHQLRGLGSGMGYPVITEIASSMLFQIKAENSGEVEHLDARLSRVTTQIQCGRNISRKRLLTGAGHGA